MAELLAAEDERPLFVSGCMSNQGKFYDRFDAVVLLSAPAEVILDRIEHRTTNDYGKTPAERALVLHHLASVEPRLRATCTHELDASRPLEDVVDALIAIGGPSPFLRADDSALVSYVRANERSDRCSRRRGTRASELVRTGRPRASHRRVALRRGAGGDGGSWLERALRAPDPRGARGRLGLVSVEERPQHALLVQQPAHVADAGQDLERPDAEL
jgi:hypothetical protein